MSADARIGALLRRWEEAGQKGSALSVEELCRDCPELVDELKRRLNVWRSATPWEVTGASAPTPPSASGTEGTSSRTAAGVPLENGPRLALQPGAELVPGYRLVQRLGGGGFGGGWKAVGAGGFSVAMKIVQLGRDREPGAGRALPVMKQVAHPPPLG